MKFLKEIQHDMSKCDDQNDWSFDHRTYYEKIYDNLICILKYVK